MYDYTVLEQRLDRLLKSLEGIFSAKETSEVREFLCAGEYGLALETMCSIITEEQKAVESYVNSEVESLRVMMEMDSDIILAFLNAPSSNE